jgi:hypothetical protein
LGARTQWLAAQKVTPGAGTRSLFSDTLPRFAMPVSRTTGASHTRRLLASGWECREIHASHKILEARIRP